MVALEVFGESELLDVVARTLDQTDGVSYVTRVDAARPGHAVVSAKVRPRSVDPLLETLHDLGVADAHILLLRTEVVGALAPGRVERTMVWADVMGTAWVNARPLARYLAFMIVAGVIACYGVRGDNNGILIDRVRWRSARDLLPITAIAVGIVGLEAQLAGRALLTLALGLATAGVAAAAATFLQDQFGFIPSAYTIQATGVLSGLTTIGNETIVVDLGRRHRRHAGAGDPCELGGGRGHLGDDHPGSRLPRSGGRPRRRRQGRRRAGGARRERPHDGARCRRDSAAAARTPECREREAAPREDRLTERLSRRSRAQAGLL